MKNICGCVANLKEKLSKLDIEQEKVERAQCSTMVEPVKI